MIMVVIDRQQENAHAEFDGHVIDDVTWPQKVQLVTRKFFEVPYLRICAK